MKNEKLERGICDFNDGTADVRPIYYILGSIEIDGKFDFTAVIAAGDQVRQQEDCLILDMTGMLEILHKERGITSASLIPAEIYENILRKTKNDIATWSTKVITLPDWQFSSVGILEDFIEENNIETISLEDFLGNKTKSSKQVNIERLLAEVKVIRRSLLQNSTVWELATEHSYLCSLLCVFEGILLSNEEFGVLTDVNLDEMTVSNFLMNYVLKDLDNIVGENLLTIKGLSSAMRAWNNGKHWEEDRKS